MWNTTWHFERLGNQKQSALNVSYSYLRLKKHCLIDIHLPHLLTQYNSLSHGGATEWGAACFAAAVFPNSSGLRANGKRKEPHHWATPAALQVAGKTRRYHFQGQRGSLWSCRFRRRFPGETASCWLLGWKEVWPIWTCCFSIYLLPCSVLLKFFLGKNIWFDSSRFISFIT